MLCGRDWFVLKFKFQAKREDTICQAKQLFGHNVTSFLGLLNLQQHFKLALLCKSIKYRNFLSIQLDNLIQQYTHQVTVYPLYPDSLLS